MKLLSIAIFLKIFFLATSVNGEIPSKNTYLQAVKNQLTKKWPRNRMVQIVVHGHSVPAGYFKTPIVNTFNSYPHLLHKKLKQKFPFAVINMTITAIGGEESDKGAKRFSSDVLSKKPDVILIDYALNDRRIGLKKAKLSWQKMILKAKSKGIKVILLTPTADKRSDIFDSQTSLSLHAQQIRGLAKKHNIALVDSYKVFQNFVSRGGRLHELMSSSNHPSYQGHEIVSQEIFKWF